MTWNTTEAVLSDLALATESLDRELAELIARATRAREALRDGVNLPFGPSNTSGLLGRSATDVEHVAGRVRTLVEVARMVGAPLEDVATAYRRQVPEPRNPAVEHGYPVTVDMTTAAVNMAEALDAAHATNYDQVKAAVGAHLITYRRAKAAAQA